MRIEKKSTPADHAVRAHDWIQASQDARMALGNAPVEVVCPEASEAVYWMTGAGVAASKLHTVVPTGHIATTARAMQHTTYLAFADAFRNANSVIQRRRDTTRPCHRKSSNAAVNA